MRKDTYMRKVFPSLKWYAYYIDVNTEELVKFNILREDLLEDLIKIVNSNIPYDYKAIKETVRRWLFYHYHSKTEYEFIISPFVAVKNIKEHKVDVYWQVEANLDRFVDYLIDKLRI